ncbi:MAG TPA: exodeoxyribonuclease III [Acetobacteraceae bacterium]|nr:exodeoxyribonuclease III [Acetobacteraceae bacterium]
MKIATWNVNSIRQRERHVCRWLEKATPDILLLQEIKCEAAAFPALTFQGLGYTAEPVGQKAYNGVAVLARVPFVVTHRRLPGQPDDDLQARYIEIVCNDMTVAGIYLPNGNSGGEAGFAYKLAWMDRLADRAAALLESDRPTVIAGDFNVCPATEDAAPGTLPATDALVRPESRARFRRLLWLGLTDAVRALHPHDAAYTFWDYQAGAWQRDLGLRIDHVLLSPTLAERVTCAEPDRNERGEPQPSDHVPVVVELN